MSEAMRLWDIEAERSVLGRLMHRTDGLRHVYYDLVADDFYDPRHRVIFAALSDLEERWMETPREGIKYVEALQSGWQLDAAGGRDYLEHLATSFDPNGDFSDLLVDRIGQLSSLRRLYSIEPADAPQDDGLPQFHDLMSSAKEVVMAIVESRWPSGDGLRTRFPVIGSFDPGQVIAAMSELGDGYRLGLNLLVDAMELNDCGFGVFSTTNSRRKTAAALFAMTTGVDLGAVRHDPPDPNKDSDRYFEFMVQLADGVCALEQHMVLIDDQALWTIDDLCRRVEAMAFDLKRRTQGRKRLRLIYIDELRYVIALDKNGREPVRTVELMTIMSALKALAVRLGITIILTKHNAQRFKRRRRRRPDAWLEAEVVDGSADMVVHMEGGGDAIGVRSAKSRMTVWSSRQRVRCHRGRLVSEYRVMPRRPVDRSPSDLEPDDKADQGDPS